MHRRNVSPPSPSTWAANIGPTGAQTVEIVVNRWSTDAERDRLLTVLREQGPAKLLDALQAVPRLGYIRTPDSIAYELHYAHKTRAKTAVSTS